LKKRKKSCPITRNAHDIALPDESIARGKKGRPRIFPIWSVLFLEGFATLPQKPQAGRRERKNSK